VGDQWLFSEVADGDGLLWSYSCSRRGWLLRS